MGLDISYYAKATLAPDGDLDDYDRFIRVYANEHFPGRAGGLLDGAIYEVDGGGGFRAGSYSGYNDWREQLAALAGYPAARDEDLRHTRSAGAWAVSGGPFWEPIHFSDCDGMIGPVVSAKLAADFAEHQARADEIGGYFAEKYACWRTAFETAAQGGLVDFH